MSLLGHDVIFIQVRWYHGLFLLAFFSTVPKHIKWPFLTKRVIHELSEEVRNSITLPLLILMLPRKFLNHGTIGRMSMKNYHRYVLSAFLYFEWTFSLSLVECYFQLNQLSLFRVLAASLKRNTDWSRQETTSRGSFYSTLGTFQILVLGCATYFIYNHEELRSRSTLNLPCEIKWSKNTNRWKHAN